MKSIVVFCASAPGRVPVYQEAAQKVGIFLAEQHITLVYGGGKVGLMGVVADAVLSGGGQAIGVIPQFLVDKEVAHQGLTELIVTQSMHERKLRMSELAEGVIALPGGFGTLEELVEMLTWSQLALHRKPVGILNVNGYYDRLQQLFSHMLEEELLLPKSHQLAIFSENIDNLYQKMLSFEQANEEQWLEKRRVEQEKA